jgi:hypothetical protein
MTPPTVRVTVPSSKVGPGATIKMTVCAGGVLYPPKTDAEQRGLLCPSPVPKGTGATRLVALTATARQLVSRIGRETAHH